MRGWQAGRYWIALINIEPLPGSALPGRRVQGSASRQVCMAWHSLLQGVEYHAIAPGRPLSVLVIQVRGDGNGQASADGL